MTNSDGKATWMNLLIRRLPGKDAMMSVLAVISFLVYGWTLVVFLWKVPSWILFLTLGEILVILAYSMTSALLESLSVLFILLLLNLLLPARWMRNVFVTCGTTAAIFGLGSIMVFLYRYSITGYGIISNLIPWSLAGLGITILMTYVATQVRPISWFTRWISDRMLIFLYLFIPLSLVSLGVVIYRNLF